MGVDVWIYSELLGVGDKKPNPNELCIFMVTIAPYYYSTSKWKAMSQLKFIVYIMIMI